MLTFIAPYARCDDPVQTFACDGGVFQTLLRVSQTLGHERSVQLVVCEAMVRSGGLVVPTVCCTRRRCLPRSSPAGTLWRLPPHERACSLC